MRVRLVVWLLLAGMSLVFSGCGEGRETDDISYTVAIGIDKAPDNRLEETFQFAIPANFTGNEASDKAQSSITNTITAANLAEARNLLNSTMSRIPNFTHTKAIIIGEDLARQGLSDILAPIMRYREFRGTIYIIVVPGTAKEFMKENESKLETSPGKYYETFMETDIESGYYLRSDFQEFYSRLKNNMGSPYATMANINPKNGEVSPERAKGAQDKADDFKAGAIPRTGSEDPADIQGMALFRGDKMIGTMNGLDTRAMALITGRLKQSFLVLADPLEPAATVNILIHNGRNPRVDAEFVDGRPVIHISLFLEGEITSIQSGINYETEEYRTLLEAQASQLLTQQVNHFIHLTQELQCDPAGLGANFRSKLDWDQVAQVDMADLYSQAEVSVDVIMKVRRTSLLWRTSPIFGHEGE